MYLVVGKVEVLKILGFELSMHNLYCILVAYLLLGCWKYWPEDHDSAKFSVSA